MNASDVPYRHDKIGEKTSDAPFLTEISPEYTLLTTLGSLYVKYAFRMPFLARYRNINYRRDLISDMIG